jgi:hypothetical protein
VPGEARFYPSRCRPEEPVHGGRSRDAGAIDAITDAIRAVRLADLSERDGCWPPSCGRRFRANNHITMGSYRQPDRRTDGGMPHGVEGYIDFRPLEPFTAKGAPSTHGLLE